MPKPNQVTTHHIIIGGNSGSLINKKLSLLKKNGLAAGSHLTSGSLLEGAGESASSRNMGNMILPNNPINGRLGGGSSSIIQSNGT